MAINMLLGCCLYVSIEVKNGLETEARGVLALADDIQHLGQVSCIYSSWRLEGVKDEVGGRLIARLVQVIEPTCVLHIHH